MGCGQSAWYDKIESEIYDKKLKKLKKIEGLSSKEILNILEKISEEVKYLDRTTTSASRGTFASIDRLINIVKEVL